MVRRLIQFIIIYAVIAIAAAAVFIGVQNVMSATYSPDRSDSFKDGEEPISMVSLAGEQAAVIGRYTTGANAGMLFCKLYDRDGRNASRQDFYLSDTQIEICDLIVVGRQLKIVCLCTPWNAGADKYGAVFTVDPDDPAGETVFFRGDAYGATSVSFDNFVAADNDGSYFAGIAGRTVVLFNGGGGQLARVMTDTFSVVTDVASDGSQILLAGTDAESSLGNSFRYGLCALYDIVGSDAKLRWQKTVMDEENTCSAVLNAKIAEDGFILTGRTLAVEGSAWQSVNRIESFEKDDDPRRFHIGPDAEKANPTSLFLLKIERDGSIPHSAIYQADTNEYVPGILRYDPQSVNSIVLSVYSAPAEYSKEYLVTLMRMTKTLQFTDADSFPVSGDTGLICTRDYAGAGLYMCVIAPGGETYRILYFTSMDDAVNHMETLKKLRPVRDFYFTLRQKTPVLIVLGFALMLSVSGAARARNRKKKSKNKT